MGTVGWNGVVYAEPSDGFNIPAATEALANSTRKVIPYFASESARNSAAAPLIADAGFDDVGLMAYVVGVGLTVYDGSGWNYCGTTTPTVWTDSYGPSGNRNGASYTSPTSFNTMSFTPTRSGWCTVHVAFHAQTIATGFDNVAAYIRQRDGASPTWVETDSQAMRFLVQEQARNWIRFQVLQPLRLTAGVSKNLSVDLFSGGGGTWNIIGIGLTATQFQ